MIPKAFGFNDMIQYSELIENFIESKLNHWPRQKWIQAQQELSSRYRTQEEIHQPLIESDLHRLIYLAARMPATYAVLSEIFYEIKRLLREVSFSSLLDLGAGPGTASWAASHVFDSLSDITLIERDRKLADLGKELIAIGSHQILKNAVWSIEDIKLLKERDPKDLCVFSYSLGELGIKEMEASLLSVWRMTKKALVIAEPGTPKGFQKVIHARDFLLSHGASILAPCPHQNACPMPCSKWCHFSKRLQRSSKHRFIKEAKLSYEDEKFSYIVALRGDPPLYNSRIVGHPLKRSSHVHLELCTSKGIIQEIISKKKSTLYRLAKKSDWGEIWPNETVQDDLNINLE